MIGNCDISNEGLTHISKNRWTLAKRVTLGMHYVI